LKDIPNPEHLSWFQYIRKQLYVHFLANKLHLYYMQYLTNLQPNI